MQKDFKIGLAIGVVLAAVAVIWLATLPNLSTRARALEAASDAKPSPQNQVVVSPPPSIENQVSPAPSKVEGSSEMPSTNNEQRTMNPEPTQRIHVVQKGDTLSSISAKYYGSANQWRKIVNANRNNLPDPNRLVPGTKLIIPE
jgi:5'-nucleotidase / UDP-sugar diphosphatase